MKWLLVILFLLLPAAALAGTGPPGCMSPTVVDGYVYFANDSAVPNANVTVSTTASDCNLWYAQSESSGYYGIPGLNIQSKTVTATAVVFVPGKGTFDGVNSSYSPNSTLRLNIIIRPTPPVLTPVPDRHNGTNVIFSWASGIEASTDATYDQFALLPASFANKVSPQTANLTFGSYTWMVRTCNSKVCSSSASDSFNIYNTPPSVPILVATNYTDSSSATLKWTSGIDTDTQPKDSLVDELQIAKDPAFATLLFSQAYSTTDGANMIAAVSGLEPAFTTFYWRVRTCDDTGASNNCSAYATNSFLRYQCAPCPPCPPGGGGGGGGAGGGSRQVYVVTLNGPIEVSRDSEFKLFINFKATQNIKEVLFDVAGQNGFSCNPEKIDDYKAETENNLVLDCKVSPGAKPGPTELTLHVNSATGQLAKKSFTIIVLGAVCGNNICEIDLGETNENCPADCPVVMFYFAYGWFWIIILIIVITTLIYKLWKEKQEEKEQELEKQRKQLASSLHKENGGKAAGKPMPEHRFLK